MRKTSTTVFILGVFLVWNVMTYWFITNRPQQKTDEPDLGRVSRQLAELQARLKVQTGVHEKLLGEMEIMVQKAKKRVVENPWQLNPPPDQHPSHLQQGPDSEKHPPLIPPHNNNEGFKPPVVHGGETALHGGADNHFVPDSAGQAGLPDDQDDSGTNTVIPVLVMACNRVTVSRCIDQLLEYRPSADRFPVIVSQDCGHAQTAQTISSYGDKVTHIRQPDLKDIAVPYNQKKFQGYFKIARHYKWALSQIFFHFNYEAVIIVEDDLDISPDFFEYFSATYPILHQDDTLWCVSAWNDNGKEGMVAGDAPELLYRTDFFPGLGWMLEKKTWADLEPKWPPTFWDDWMRHPDQRKERACIRPEVSRTSTFGKIGVSKGQYFDKHLKFIKLNKQPVKFTEKDLSYLTKEEYDPQFVQQVYSAPLMEAKQVTAGYKPHEKVVRVEYRDKKQFKDMAKLLGIMDDLKSGVPRAGYRGVVSFFRNDRRVYLAPPSDWAGYDLSWN